MDLTIHHLAILVMNYESVSVPNLENFQGCSPVGTASRRSHHNHAVVKRLSSLPGGNPLYSSVLIVFLCQLEKESAL